jgi:hypothetical protein
MSRQLLMRAFVPTAERRAVESAKCGPRSSALFNPRVDIGNCPRLSLFASEQLVGFGIGYEALRVGVPFQFTTDLHCNITKVGDSDRSMSRFGRRVTRLPRFDTVYKVTVLAAVE